MLTIELTELISGEGVGSPEVKTCLGPAMLHSPEPHGTPQGTLRSHCLDKQGFRPGKQGLQRIFPVSFA